MENTIGLEETKKIVSELEDDEDDFETISSVIKGTLSEEAANFLDGKGYFHIESLGLCAISKEKIDHFFYDGIKKEQVLIF